jgi:hypothetical protein
MKALETDAKGVIVHASTLGDDISSSKYFDWMEKAF